jgi:hypothetical protein
MKKLVYSKPSMTVTDVTLDGVLCVSVTGKTDGDVNIGNGGGTQEGGVQEGQVKQWGGSIFDEYDEQ